MQKALLLSVLLFLVAYAPGGPARAKAGPSVEELPAQDDGARSADDTPDGYTLSAAYPNPFRARTRFQLSVDETQRVTVSVYNILGQRVRSLFSGLVESGQAQSFSFEARALPSGLYLYRVEGETFTATRRVTIVR